MKRKPAKKPSPKTLKKAVVAIVMGSRSDLETMNEAAKALELFKVPYKMEVLSAHRTPEEVSSFAKKARKSGFRVIIAGAGGAAHLPGMVAAHTELPVIGVPVAIGPLNGNDALLSIVQMPRGIPVATVAIGNAWNAGILAVQILGAGGSDKILDALHDYKTKMRDDVLAKGLTK